jgi:hypothetical protein
MNLWDLIPDSLKGADETGDLEAFCQVIDSWLPTLTELSGKLAVLYDVSQLDAELEYLAGSLGIEYPKDAELEVRREIVRNAVGLYQRRGTAWPLLYLIPRICGYVTSVDSLPAVNMPFVVGDPGHIVAGLEKEFEVDDYTRGLWHFNEGMGAATDDETDYGNDLAFSMMGVLWQDGLFGTKCVSLDGSMGYLSAPYDASLNLTNSFTIEGWVKPSAVDGERPICNRNSLSNYGLLIEDGELKVTVGNSSESDSLSGGTVTAGEWHHVAAVFRRNGTVLSWTLELYVNGRLVASKTTAVGNGPSTSVLYVGQRAGTEFYAGRIEELRLSALAANAGVIWNHYWWTWYLKTSGTEQDLMSYVGVAPDARVPMIQVRLEDFDGDEGRADVVEHLIREWSRGRDYVLQKETHFPIEEMLELW